MTLEAPLVYVVTDRRRVSPAAATSAHELDDFERWLGAVVEAGPDVIQLRERDLDTVTLVRLAARLVARAAGTRTRIFVNDRSDVASAVGAAGLHLRAGSPAAARVRPLGPATWTVGRSVHSVADVAGHQDADYLLFGSVFPTASKPHGSPVVGIDALESAAATSGVPVLAIGGVDVPRAALAAAAGAAGVAAIGVFLPAGSEPSALGPARAVAALRAAMLQ